MLKLLGKSALLVAPRPVENGVYVYSPLGLASFGLPVQK